MREFCEFIGYLKVNGVLACVTERGSLVNIKVCVGLISRFDFTFTDKDQWLTH